MKLLTLLLVEAVLCQNPAGAPPKLDIPKRPEPSDTIEHPAFEAYPVSPGEFADASLFEQFSDVEDAIWSRWKKSHAKKAGTDEEWSYVGEWSIEDPKVFPGFRGDKGLVLKSEAAHHAISNVFDKPLDNKGKTLVAQYEVKLGQALNCGGAYLKLLKSTPELGTTEFSNDTPYVIMFGPDRCGATDKIHLIINLGGEEHHLNLPPRSDLAMTSTLYTLIIHEDQHFEVRANGDVVKAGLLTAPDAFTPSLLPPAEIDDPNDVKPQDWVDEKVIPDPEQTEKPEDWDEDAPLRIPDPEAVIPEDWREDLEPFIPDPTAVMPEEWDEDEDGEWIPAEVPNPECEGLSGCGPWKAPLIHNPDYKGKWTQPLIPNPEYKGEWKPRKIPNPDYNPDARPSDLEPIGGIGFELWTMQPEILFDNIYVGQSIEEAENIGNATWSPKFYLESQELENNRNAAKKAAEEQMGELSSWDELKADPLGFLAYHYNVFLNDLQIDARTALVQHPVTAATIFAVLAVVTSALFGLLNILISTFTGSKPTEPEKVTKSAEKEPATSVDSDSTASAVASKTESELRKRKN